jgi:plastocyanin
VIKEQAELSNIDPTGYFGAKVDNPEKYAQAYYEFSTDHSFKAIFRLPGQHNFFCRNLK